MQKADQGGPLTHDPNFGPGRLLNFEDHVRRIVKVSHGHYLRPGLFVGFIQVVVPARAGLDEHLEAFVRKLTYGLRHEGHALLALDPLFGNPDLHTGIIS